MAGNLRTSGKHVSRSLAIINHRGRVLCAFDAARLEAETNRGTVERRGTGERAVIHRSARRDEERAAQNMRIFAVFGIQRLGPCPEPVAEVHASPFGKD